MLDRCSCAKLVAIDIEPAPLFAHETAAFVHAHGTARGVALARHEFDFGMFAVDAPVRLHRQPQPFGAGVEVQPRRALAGMLGGQQVGRVFPHEGAVARTHQRLGVGRRPIGEAVDVAAAAVGMGQWFLPAVETAAGTWRGGWNVRHRRGQEQSGDCIL